jgi:hypothetical protein
MSHLRCYFQLFNIHNSLFFIHNSSFDNSSLDSLTFDNSTFRQFIIRNFDNSTIRHFIILNFRKSTALPQIKSSALSKYILSNYVAMCAMWLKKNHHLTVLANPQFLDRRHFGQNLETIQFLYLQRCRTSGAISSYSTFDIHHSKFIIHNSTFHHSTFRHFISSTVQHSTFHHSTIRQFDIRQFDSSTVRQFDSSTFDISSFDNSTV